MCYGAIANYPWWGWIGMGVMLLFWAVILALMVWAVVKLVGRTGGPSSGAVDLLKRRLAAGEISAADYEQTRRTLNT